MSISIAHAQGAGRVLPSAAPEPGGAGVPVLAAPKAAAAPRSGRTAAAVASVAPGAAVTPGGESAQGISVTVALPGGALTVGERAEAVVTLRVPAARLAAEPRFPVWRDAWGEAEVREHGEVRRRSVAAGEAAFSQRLVLAAFRTGKVELPRMTIAVPLRDGTVQALTPARLALTVRSVLPAAGGKDVQPRPAAALRPLPLGLAFYCVLGALLLLVGAAVWALRRQARRRAAGGETAAPRLPQLAELLASLDGLAGRRAPLAVHIGISQALRRYLGRATGIPAPESTTSEIQRRLLARGWPAAMVRRTAELLRACDMVKFAREDVGEARAAERLAQARQLGQDFETQVEARAALAAAAAAADNATGTDGSAAGGNGSAAGGNGSAAGANGSAASGAGGGGLAWPARTTQTTQTTRNTQTKWTAQTPPTARTTPTSQTARTPQTAWAPQATPTTQAAQVTQTSRIARPTQEAPTAPKAWDERPTTPARKAE